MASDERSSGSDTGGVLMSRPHFGSCRRRANRPHTDRDDQQREDGDRGQPGESLCAAEWRRRGRRREQVASRLVDLEACVGDVAEPTLVVLLQAAAQQTPNRVRRARGQPPASRARSSGSPPLYRRSSRPGTRPARQHLEQHAPERPHVRPPVCLLPLRLLRRHVAAVPRIPGIDAIIVGEFDTGLDPIVGPAAPSRGRSPAPSRCRRAAP